MFQIVIIAYLNRFKFTELCFVGVGLHLGLHKYLLKPCILGAAVLIWLRQDLVNCHYEFDEARPRVAEARL